VGAKVSKTTSSNCKANFRMRKKQIPNGLLSILLAFIFLPCQAQSGFYKELNKGRVQSSDDVIWEQVSPGNAGYANLVRYHPTIAKKVTLIPDMWNAYQSENNGKSWYGITDHDGDATFYHHRDLYYSPLEPNFGLAICSSELWKSIDGGRSWETVKNCPWYNVNTEGRDKEGWRKKVGSLAIDPNNKDVWFVGGGSNVRGQEWMSCYKDANHTNPRGKSADYEGKLWRTTNAGASWDLVNSGLNPKAQVGRIIVNPKNSQQVFASSNYGIYKSENGGTSWRQVSSGQLDNDIIMDMDFYYNATNNKFILYAIDQVHYIPEAKTTKCTGGIFMSDDEGDSWIKINGDLALDINRLSGGVPKNYYMYISKWLDISENKAKALYPDLPTSALQYFNMISADPSREGAVYIGFADPQVGNSIMPGRVWVTTNNGQKWISTARLYQDSWEKDKDYWNERGNPYHENMEVGHASPHMRFGTNYALRSTRGLDVGVDGSVMIISDHSTMLSTDNGATWKQVDEDYTPSGGIIGRGNSNLPGLTIAQDKRDKTTLLGAGEHHLWIPVNDSPDDRQAIKYVNSTQKSVISLAFDPYDVKIAYSTSSRQENKQNIFRSTNGGWDWSMWGVATPATNKWGDDFYTNSLTVDPINNNNIYFGITRVNDKSKSTQGGFFASTDQGKTFSQRNTGLPSPVRVRDIEFDPRDNTRASLFIAAEKYAFTYEPPTADGGLYHSTNRGQNWTKVNTPTEVEGVQFIEIDHTNRMYITTGYRGSGAGVWYTDDFGDSWHQVFEYPGTECINVSPFDHNLIAVSVRFSNENPGFYISRNRGATWAKSNTNIVIPHRIEDIKFDIHNPAQIWIATLGTGFYKGQIKNGDKVQVVKVTPSTLDYRSNVNKQLKAEVINADFADEKISWKSENPGIVTVDQNGLITPIGKGKTKVWATTEDGRYSDYCVVVIHEINN
jgi:photosystem II stability/assembly factor-like uncharacterized protein